MKNTFLKKQAGGSLTIEIIVWGGVSMILISGFILWAYSFLNFSLRDYHRAQALMIAEAGLEYYRWHLAHDKTDYQDGIGEPGPYIHNYYDKNGNLIGHFTLEITPPPSGSTIVTIKSTGDILADPTIRRIVRVKLGIPSFAKYAFVTASNMRFGAGTEVFGEIVSNGGIRFDGIAHNIVKSALYSYDDPDHSGANEFGVHTHVSPVDPLPSGTSSPPNRPDVFMAGRQLSVPAVDFAGMTQDLANIKSAATSSGVYVPTSTTGLGYELVLNASGTYAVYRVTGLVAPPSNCTNYLNQSGWGTWSIGTKTLYSSGTIPANGIFFIEDNLWVKGKINDARITVGSGKFPDNPSTRTSVTVNENLLYTNYDGRDVIQLIAQNNLNIGMVSSSTLRVDAMLIAQNGRVGRYYYRPPGGGYQRCSPYHTRNEITSYGTIVTSLRYGFAYTDGTGYILRNLLYDSNLLYAPPPLAPQTSDQYVQVSWEELQ